MCAWPEAPDGNGLSVADASLSAGLCPLPLHQGVPDRDGVELLQLPQIQQHELQPNQRVQCGSRLSGSSPPKV